MGSVLAFCYFRPEFEGFEIDELNWDAAHHEELLAAARGNPPLSRALCPKSRQPLRYSTGRQIVQTAVCARSGQPVDLSGPHFFCLDSGTIVSMSEGPVVYVERDCDFYDSVAKQGTIIGSNGERQNLTMQNDCIESGDSEIVEGVMDLATSILTEARELGKHVRKESLEAFDYDWETDGVLEKLFNGEDDPDELASNIKALAGAVRDVVAAQPTVTDVDVPCKVFGDTHGQLRDVLVLFNTYGWPGLQDAPSFVFNGDFVDRGMHDLELLCIYFALKVSCPDRVWLIRGNHEDSTVNEDYGFQASCHRFFGSEIGDDVFDAIQAVFNMLPLACIIGERIITLHGGLGHGNWDIEHLRRTKRPIEPWQIDESPTIYNILWSDPIEENDPDNEATFGVHESDRGESAVTFGFDVTVNFLTVNGLGLLIRSHQSKVDGCGFDVMHDEMLVRVFSARNYEGHANHSAILYVRKDSNGLLVVRPQMLGKLSVIGGMRQLREASLTC